MRADEVDRCHMRGEGSRLTGVARARALGNLLLWTGILGLTAAWLFTAAASPAGGQEGLPRAPELYQRHCAHCHGTQGTGTYRGPTLVGVGAASADFYLRSGRMPIAHPAEEVERGEPAFGEEQIRELVDYVAALGEGPAIPTVAPEGADLGVGGELYRLHCAACHNWDGKGGALVNRQNAPNLHGVPARQVAEAIRIGPGAMPVFGEDLLTDEQLNEVVAYVVALEQPRDLGGFGLFHWGPAVETLAAFVALGGLLLVTAWLGEHG